jgi:hypothetical protein
MTRAFFLTEGEKRFMPTPAPKASRAKRLRHAIWLFQPVLQLFGLIAVFFLLR